MFSFQPPNSKIKIWNGFLLIIRRNATHILWGFILIGVILNSYSIYEKKRYATPEALIPLTLKDMNIRLSDLTRESPTIRDRTFENCHIYGPAVIHSAGSTIIFNNEWDVTSESALVITTNEKVSGAILFKDCIIKNCVLHGISFIGSESQIAQIRAKNRL